MSDDTAHKLKVERKGGLAGFGSPNSRVRSLGSVDLRTLSTADRQTVERMFAGDSRSASPPRPVRADAFQYHLTMTTPQGEKTVVVPEDHVPDAIRDSVQDELL
ncbi:MAG TPA: protealysin inhibitor emfourin [Polyangia bacterium]|nr:protealysin inhibitor emfourin [Polyangia bacterium]